MLAYECIAELKVQNYVQDTQRDLGWVNMGGRFHIYPDSKEEKGKKSSKK